VPDLTQIQESLLTEEQISSRLENNINESKKEHQILIEYNNSKMATLISEKEDLYRQEATLRTDYDISVHNNCELESLMDEKDIDLHSARIEFEDSISIRKFQETDLQETKKSFNRKIMEKIEMGGKLEKTQFALKRANADL
jgi:hypothetical protein